MKSFQSMNVCFDLVDAISCLALNIIPLRVFLEATAFFFSSKRLKQQIRIANNLKRSPTSHNWAVVLTQAQSEALLWRRRGEMRHTETLFRQLEGESWVLKPPWRWIRTLTEVDRGTDGRTDGRAGGSKAAITWVRLCALPFTFSPTDQASQEEAQRAWTVVRDLPPGEVVCAADPGCGGQGGGDGRPNGWATFVGDVPEPPPPPRTSTLRKEKKVTILEQAVQRL